MSGFGGPLQKALFLGGSLMRMFERDSTERVVSVRWRTQTA
jgi:hypothetical protein